MKLKNIEIKNFLGIKEADINFKPVNVILGGNGHGKSSIRDAICFALTGKVTNRGYAKKNQAPRLKNRYVDGDMSVVLTTDSGAISRNAKTGTKAMIDPDIAEIMCNPQTVLKMKPAERQKIFSAILQSDHAAEQIEATLKAEGDWPDEVVKQCKADLDDAQQWAIEQRRIANRTIKDMQETARHKPDSFVEIDGDTVDFMDREMTIANVDNIIDRRECERDNLIKNQVTDENKDEIAKLLEVHKRELEEFPASEKLQADYEDRQQQLVKANKAYNEIDSKIGQLNAELSVLTGKIKRLDRLGDKCSECRQQINPQHKEMMVKETEIIRDKIADQLETANSKRADLSSDVSEASTAVGIARTKCETADKDRQFFVDKIAELETTMAKIKTADEDKAKIAELDRKLKNGRTIRDALRLWHDYQLNESITNEKRDKLEATATMMDKLDKLLKPDGELRKIANQDMESVPFDSALKTVWGMDGLTLGAAGEVTLDGDPIEAASDSEKYRAGLLLSELLGRKIGLGILILDGIEILSTANRSPLFGRMPTWMKSFDTIILISTVTEKPPAPKDSWLAIHWVDNGSVTEIK